MPSTSRPIAFDNQDLGVRAINLLGDDAFARQARQLRKGFKFHAHLVPRIAHSPPMRMMAAMAFETGRRFTADVKNPRSSATGLIQFMESTATLLGTTIEAVRGKPAPPKLMEWLTNGAFYLFLGLALYVTFHDLGRIPMFLR